jgi:predicted RecA/RadA family phage recombinase
VATNIVYEAGDNLDYVCTHPTTPASGDPVRIGDFCGVALTAERSSGKTSVTTRGVATLSVKGIDGNGNSAVVVGDTLYYVDGDTPVLSKKTAGKKFGYALAAIDAGATATIQVKISN